MPMVSRRDGYSVHGAHSENPSLGNNAAPTHDKPRVSSGEISELLRVLEKEARRKNKGPLAIGGLYRICIGLGDNTAMRYEILASGDRL